MSDVEDGIRVGLSGSEIEPTSFRSQPTSHMTRVAQRYEVVHIEVLYVDIDIIPFALHVVFTLEESLRATVIHTDVIQFQFPVIHPSLSFDAKHTIHPCFQS